MIRNVLFVLLCLLSVWAVVILLSDGPLATVFHATPALSLVSMIALGLAVAAFAMSGWTADHSWVDRLWSTAPVVFGWIYATKANLAPAALIGAVVVSLWGLRLTLNFARKGGYSGTEDYRWPILRKQIHHPALWQLFNLVFICGVQIGLFVLFTAPFVRMTGIIAYPRLFGMAVAAFVAFVIVETSADQQQWDFHRAKAAARSTSIPERNFLEEYEYKGDVEGGFLKSGLFLYSRHPAYFGEIGVWWAFYAMGAAAAGRSLHWSLIGPVALTLLFIGSTRFTESITKAKYPSYADYQRRTSAIFPLWPALEPQETPAAAPLELYEDDSPETEQDGVST